MKNSDHEMKKTQLMINLCTHDSVIHELDMFIQHKLEGYARYRNYDFGSKDNNYVSALSPAITRGIITEEYIVNRVLATLRHNLLF